MGILSGSQVFLGFSLFTYLMTPFSLHACEALTGMRIWMGYND